MRMIKKNMLYPAALIKRIEDEVSKTGLSFSETVRRAVDEYLTKVEDRRNAETSKK